MIDPSLLTARPAWVQVGLVLVHFIWQGAAIALLLATVLWLLRRRSPNARYACCGGAMLVMVLCPLATLVYVRANLLPIVPVVSAASRPGAALSAIETATPSAGPTIDASTTTVTVDSPTIDAPIVDAYAAPPDVVIDAEPAEPPETPIVAARSDESVAASATAWPNEWLSRGLEIAALAWTLGVLVLSGRLFAGWLALRRTYVRDAERLPDTIRTMVRELSARLGLRRPACVIGSRAWHEPIAFGLLRPIVLLPAAMLTQCPPELVEAMIAHELAHIRRYDLWANVLQRVIETLLFYHPAVWWVSGRMRLERELCCDDLAVGATGRQAEYATALVEICRAQPALAAPAMAAGMLGPRLTLMMRVRRVLNLPAAPRESNRGRFWIAGPLSLTLAGLLVFAACLRIGGMQNGVASAAPAGTPPAGTTTRPASERRAASTRPSTRHAMRIETPDGALEADTIVIARGPALTAPPADAQPDTARRVWTKQVPVRSMADGLVAEIKVKEGQAVKKGDLLVQLDDAELKLDLKAGEVRLQSAGQKIERLQALEKAGMNTVSNAELQDAEAAYTLAKVDAQRCRLKLERTRIVSPADGTADFRDAGESAEGRIGKRVAAGDTLLFIVVPDTSPERRASAPAGQGPAPTPPWVSAAVGPAATRLDVSRATELATIEANVRALTEELARREIERMRLKATIDVLTGQAKADQTPRAEQIIGDLQGRIRQAEDELTALREVAKRSDDHPDMIVQQQELAQKRRLLDQALTSLKKLESGPAPTEQLVEAQPQCLRITQTIPQMRDRLAQERERLHDLLRRTGATVRAPTTQPALP